MKKIQNNQTTRCWPTVVEAYDVVKEKGCQKKKKKKKLHSDKKKTPHLGFFSSPVGIHFGTMLFAQPECHPFGHFRGKP